MTPPRLPTLLVTLAVLAACGDDDATGSGGASASGGATSTTTATTGSSTTSTSASTTATTATTATSATTAGSGGAGEGGSPAQGGSTGQGGFDCEDDEQVCERQIERLEGCGDPVPTSAECAVSVECLRRLYRDEVECDLLTCGATGECDASCSTLLLDHAPSATGEEYLETCLDVLPDCEGDDAQAQCTVYGYGVADDILEDLLPCFDEAECADIEGCLEGVLEAIPECPDV
jgi:hypothetical protein